jgi:hypothetical protein
MRKANEPDGLGQGLFWGLLSLGVLAGCAGYAALVLGTATWAEARALDAIFPYYHFHIRAFSAVEYQKVCQGLAAVAAVAGAAWIALGGGLRSGRTELVATGHALGQSVRRLWAAWRALPLAQRRLAGAGLAGLTAFRTYLSLATPWYDDAVSFEFFVRHRLLAVSAYYPLPNNHILTNTIGWLCYQVHPTFWWSMRMPVLLTSTLATGLLLVGLLRRAGFWPALLASGVFSWVELSLYHAAAGRAYWLVSLLAGLMFLSVLVLSEAPAGEAASRAYQYQPRAAWLVLVGAGVLACYAVPPAVYVVGSAVGWLGVRAWQQRAWALLRQALLAGVLVGVGTALLYVPVLLVSGWEALFANPYVLVKPPQAFWGGLPEYLWVTEGALAGQRTVGVGLTVAGLALFGRLVYRAATGQLPVPQARRVWRLGVPALWFMLFPYAMLAVQRVLPPERTLLYKSWFFFILVGLGLQDWPWHRRDLRWLAGVGLALFGSYQSAMVLRSNYQLRQRTASYWGVYAWLAARSPIVPALIPDLGTWAWTRFSAHIELPGQPWPIDNAAQPGVRYRYVVLSRGPIPVAGAGRLVYANEQFLIYTYVAPATVPAPVP